MIDSKNIFPEIKNVIIKKRPYLHCVAVGSRVRGTSIKKKWDFDVMLVGSVDLKDLKEITDDLKNHFSGRLDEFGKQIKVDILRSIHKDLKIALEIRRNGKLL